MKKSGYTLMVAGTALMVWTTPVFAGTEKNNLRVCVQVTQKDVHEKKPLRNTKSDDPEGTRSTVGLPEASNSEVAEKPAPAKVSSTDTESPPAATGEGTTTDGAITGPDATTAPAAEGEGAATVNGVLGLLGAPDSSDPEAQTGSHQADQWESFYGDPAGAPIEGWDQAVLSREKSLVYIKRLVEYFVTHEPGYEAVQDNCDETINVELYPLSEGWTAFARFTKTGREERVDNLHPDELSQFSERAVLSLIYDVSISETIARDTVLRADSKKARQKIKGNSHFTMAVGTQIRGGRFDTAQTDSAEANYRGVENRIRVFAPMQLMLGYRGRFEVWGIEATSHLGFGTNKTAANQNPTGGHVDLGVNTGLSLHFLRYAKPRGLTSLYGGAGGTFELVWFSTIAPETRDDGDRRDYLVTGGLGVDLVGGVEFMRASSVQFFVQGELNLPAYVIDSANSNGKIHTWFPGATLLLGVVF